MKFLRKFTEWFPNPLSLTQWTGVLRAAAWMSLVMFVLSLGSGWVTFGLSRSQGMLFSSWIPMAAASLLDSTAKVLIIFAYVAVGRYLSGRSESIGSGRRIPVYLWMLAAAALVQIFSGIVPYLVTSGVRPPFTGIWNQVFAFGILIGPFATALYYVSAGVLAQRFVRALSVSVGHAVPKEGTLLYAVRLMARSSTRARRVLVWALRSVAALTLAVGIIDLGRILVFLVGEVFESWFLGVPASPTGHPFDWWMVEYSVQAAAYPGLLALSFSFWMQHPEGGSGWRRVGELLLLLYWASAILQLAWAVVMTVIGSVLGIMPGMSAISLVFILPTLAVVFATGYAARAISRLARSEAEEAPVVVADAPLSKEAYLNNAG